MIHLMIDGQSVEVEEGTTILEAAKKVCIRIPTLCHHEDLSIKAVCRICVVEVEGQRLLPTACSTPVSEGMVVHTASPKVLKARRNILELIFARYPQKCILCGRCLEVCNEIQGMNVLSKENRGFQTLAAPAYGEKLADTNCINCGQCVQVCPTGALTVHYHTYKLLKQKKMGKKLVIQVAPSVRITLAEALGEKPGIVSTGCLVSALKRLGFYKVFDSDFSADLTIMEEGTELMHRLKNGGPLPMITSCCPAWVKYCETYAPQYTGHLSTAKSPQQMFGAMIKTWFAAREGLDPSQICSVSVMPCTAKKFECTRSEMNASGYQDVDLSITVQELANLIRSGGIDFSELPDTPFDDPFGIGSGAGLIFGATGGVMEAAIRSVYALTTGREMESLEYHEVRGFKGIKEASVNLDGAVVKVAAAHGMKNAKLLLEQIKEGKANYQFIEIMACPGGCIGGGGNPPKTWKIMEERRKAIYEAETKLPVRLSHKNPAIKRIYETYLGEPCGEKSHKLLHTHYYNRQDLLR